MNYLIDGESASLQKLFPVFQEACHSQGVRVNRLKATLIILKFLGDAKEQGIVKELGGAFDSPEIRILENLGH